MIKVVASPRMVSTHAVGRQRAAKVGLRDDGDLLPNASRFHLGHKLLEGAVNFSHLAVETFVQISVRIELPLLDDEHVALRF